jgi:hypothetical protein
MTNKLLIFRVAKWLISIIPATQEAEIWRTMVQGQPRQKVCKNPSQQTSWRWWHTPVVSATGESIGSRITVQGCPRAKNKTYLKSKLKQKRVGYNSSSRSLAACK